MAPDPAAFPERRIGAVPLTYWHDRYLEALSKAERSRDSALRDIYLELADHYYTMDVLVGGSEGDSNIGDRGHPNGKVLQ